MPTLDEILNDLDKAEKKQTIYDEQPSSVSDVMFYLTHQEELQKNTQAALEKNANPSSLDSVIAVEERNQQVNQALTGSRFQNLEDRGNGFFQAKPDHIPWSENAFMNVVESPFRAISNIARGAQKNVGDLLETTEDFYNSILDSMGIINDESDDKIDALHELSKKLQEQVPDVPLSDSAWDQFFFSLGAPQNKPETESKVQNFTNQIGYVLGHGLKESMPIIAGSGLAAGFSTAVTTSRAIQIGTKLFGAGLGGAIGSHFTDQESVAEGIQKGVTMDVINTVFNAYSRPAQIIAGTMMGATIAAFQNDMDSPEYAENVAVDAILNTVFAMFGPAGKRSMLRDVNKVATNTKAWVLRQKRNGQPFDVTAYMKEFHNVTYNNFKDAIVNKPNRQSAISDLQNKLAKHTGKDVNSTGKDLSSEIQDVLLKGEDAQFLKPKEAQAFAEGIVKAAEVIDNPKNFLEDGILNQLIKDAPEIITVRPDEANLKTINIADGLDINMTQAEASAFISYQTKKQLASESARINNSNYQKGLKQQVKEVGHKFLTSTVAPDAGYFDKIAKTMSGGKENKLFSKFERDVWNQTDLGSQVLFRQDQAKTKIRFDQMSKKERLLFDERISLYQEKSIIDTEISKLKGSKKVKAEDGSVVPQEKLKTKKSPFTKQEVESGLLANEAEIRRELGEDGFVKFEEKVDSYYQEPYRALDRLLEDGVITKKTHSKLRGRRQPPSVFISQLEEQLKLLDDPEYNASFSRANDIEFLRKTDGEFRVTDSELLLDRWIKKLEYLRLRNKPLITARNIAIENPDNPFIKIPKRKFTDDSGREIIIKGDELIVDKKQVKFRQTPIVEDGFEVIPFLQNGKTDYIMVPKEFAAFWKQNKQMSKTYMQMMKAIGFATGVRPLKALVVGVNPTFALANWFRDTSFFWKTNPFEDANLLKYMGGAVKSLPKIFSDIKNKRGDWTRYHEAGGTSATLSRLEANYLAKARQERYYKDVGLPTKTWREFVDKMSWFGSTMEEATRIHAMKQLENTRKPDGSYYTTEEAVHLVNQQLNFKRKGSLLDIANEIIPFANASAQVIAGLSRSAKANPKRFMSKAMQYFGARVMMGSVAYTMAAEVMDKISIKDKIGNIIVPIGISNVNNENEIEDMYFKLPVEKDPATVMLDSLYFASMDILRGKDKETVIKKYWDTYKSEFANQINVDFFGIPTFEAYKAIFENVDPLSGENIWKGSPLVNMEDRFTPNKTSSAAIALGQLTGTSPVGIERAVGTVGLRSNVVSNFAGHLLSDVSDEEKQNASKAVINMLPGASRFLKFTNNFDELLDARIRESTSERKTRVQDKVSEIRQKFDNKELDLRQSMTAIKKSDLNSIEKKNAIKSFRLINNGNIAFDRVVERFGQDILYEIPTKSDFRKISIADPKMKAKWYLEKLPPKNQNKLRNTFRSIAKSYGFSGATFGFYLLEEKRRLKQQAE